MTRPTLTLELPPLLADKHKRQLLRDLAAVEAAFDLCKGAGKGVVAYLAKRQLAICLQLADNDIARQNVLRTARQLGFSGLALKRIA